MLGHERVSQAIFVAGSLSLLAGARLGVAVSVVVVVAMGASVVPLARDGRHARPADAAIVLVPAVVATPFVVWALRGFDPHLLAVAGGIGVLAGVVLLLSGLRAGWLRTTWGGVSTGVASAVLNVVGGVGGPPVGMYAASTGWEPARMRGTLHVYFLLQNGVTALLVGVAMPSWSQAGCLLAGSAAGVAVASRLPARSIRWGVLALSAVGGLLLVGAPA